MPRSLALEVGQHGVVSAGRRHRAHIHLRTRPGRKPSGRARSWQLGYSLQPTNRDVTLQTRSARDLAGMRLLGCDFTSGTAMSVVAYW